MSNIWLEIQKLSRCVTVGDDGALILVDDETLDEIEERMKRLLGGADPTSVYRAVRNAALRRLGVGT